MHPAAEELSQLAPDLQGQEKLDDPPSWPLTELGHHEEAIALFDEMMQLARELGKTLRDADALDPE
jgi:hypothetical protein